MPAEVYVSGRWPLQVPGHREHAVPWATWEAERLASMHDWIVARDGPVVYDVGAEEGDMSALYASWGAKVHAFEPNPDVWPNIRVCFEANGLKPPNCYSGFAGDVDRNWRQGTNWEWPQSAYGEVIPDHGFCQLNERPDIPSVTLDTYADYIVEPPDAVTMDVEGSELRVLNGARWMLRNFRPTLWVAVHPTFMQVQYGDDPADLHGMLDDFGYVGELLADDHEQHWLYRPEETA